MKSEDHDLFRSLCVALMTHNGVLTDGTLSEAERAVQLIRQYERDHTEPNPPLPKPKPPKTYR